MSLEKWAEYGWLRRQPTSADEIKGLLKVVERDLRDPAIDKISNDLRLIAALGAALQSAAAALRASGYRATDGRGQREKTVESLYLTVGADSKTIQKLKTFSRKRNRANYDVADAVSDQELREIMKCASELRDQVKAWLEKKHPNLMR